MTGKDTPARFKIFCDHKNLIAAISTKRDGNCYFAPTSNMAADKATLVNRATVLAGFDIPYDRVVSAGLVHGIKIHRATTADDDSTVRNVDALFANERDLFLSITVADCLPIFLFDPETKTFGLIHAGWRGLAAGIVPNAIRAMRRECGVRTEHLLAGIGPGIGACHFEVKDDVAEQFTDFPNAVIRRDGAIFIDLKAIARDQLVTLGLEKEHVEISNECTYDVKDKYFSWRRDKPPVKETMMAVIGLR